jgi:archaellum component FlaC
VTNVQLYVGVGLPALAVVSSLIISLMQISGIREDIREIRAEVRDIRNDIKLLVGALNDLDKRVTRIELKLGIQP